MPQYFENFDVEKEIKETCLIEGDFLLSSGVRSDYYFDKYLFEANPHLLFNIAVRMTRHMPNNWHDMAFLFMADKHIMRYYKFNYTNFLWVQNQIQWLKEIFAFQIEGGLFEIFLILPSFHIISDLFR